MDYESKAVKVIERFNNGEGTVVDLCKDEGIGRSAFYSNLEKLGYRKAGDIYIQENKEVDGQIHILGADKEAEERGQVKEVEQIASDDIKASNKVKEVIRVKEVRRKKTFEISEGVEAAIKIMATLEGKTINDYVNDTLEKSIDDKVKKMVLETYQF